MIKDEMGVKRNIIFIAEILSQVASIEGLAFSLFKGFKRTECVILCVKEDSTITEKVLQDNFGLRNELCEIKTGVNFQFRLVPSSTLTDEVKPYNAMDLKSLMNSEILVDKYGRLVNIQKELKRTKQEALGTYTEQIKLEDDICTRTMTI